MMFIRHFYYPNSFMNEEEPIECNCFSNRPAMYSSGLKPSKLTLSQSSGLLSSSKETFMMKKGEQTDNNKLRTSLKRNKPVTPV